MDTNHSNNAAHRQARKPITVTPPPNPTVGWSPGNDGPRHLIVVSLPHITTTELRDFAAPLRFDLCLYHELLVLMMTTRRQPYATVWAAMDDDEAIEPDPTENQGRVGMLVIEHTTGVVMAGREFVWEPHFASTVEAQLVQRQNAPVTTAHAQRRREQLSRDVRMAKDLFDRSITSCLVGF